MVGEILVDVGFLEKKVVQGLRIYSRIIDCKERALVVVERNIKRSREEEKKGGMPSAFVLSAFFGDVELNRELFDPMLRCVYDEQRFVRILASANDGYDSNVDKALTFLERGEKQLKKVRGGKDLLKNVRVLKSLTLLFKENFSEMQKRLQDQIAFLARPTYQSLNSFRQSWKKDILEREKFMRQFSKAYSKLTRFVEMFRQTTLEDVKGALGTMGFGAALGEAAVIPASGIVYGIFTIAGTTELTTTFFLLTQAAVLGFSAFASTFIAYEEQKEKAEKVLGNRFAAQLGIR